MGTIKMTGRTVEGAVKAAAAILGTTVDQIQYEVTKEGKAAFLGVMGGEEVEIEARMVEKPGEIAKDMLQTIVDNMGFMAIVYLINEEMDKVELEIRGDDLGRLIGKEGKAIEAFQTLLFAMLNRRLGRKIRVLLEIAGYKEKERGRILAMAQKSADRVRQNGQPESLPSMNSFNRRLIHEMFANDPLLQTISEGEGKDRHLIISIRNNG